MTASYSGDADDGASQATVMEVVQQSSPLVVLASSTNPSKVGQAVTFTALLGNTVSSPSGTITFEDGGTVLATVPVSASGTIFQTAALAQGAHSITAVYSGDTDNGDATSAVVMQNVQQPTTTTLASSSNPALGGTPVTFTAMVHAANGGRGDRLGELHRRLGPAGCGTDRQRRGAADHQHAYGRLA